MTLAEYVDGAFNLPANTSPVVITFDDSPETQFSYRKDGSIDPGCAVGIWQKFARENPDFPIKATWFILPNGPFGHKKSGKKKLQQLMAWGSEIASHTMTHRPLDRLSDLDVKKELVRSMHEVKRLTGKAPRTLALPYGNIPKNRDLLHGFYFNGKKYWYDAVVLAGSGPAPSPHNKNRNLKLLPRIKVYGGELGFDYWFDRFEAGATKAYVTE